MFAGLMGALAGVLYVAVRWMLPWSGWRRGLLFGGIVFAIGGADVLDRGTNPDYRQFGIAGLNVCLFGLLPVLFGLICAPLADAWIGRVQGWQPRRFGWIAVAMTAPFVAIFVIGLLANVTSMPWLTLVFLPGGVKLLARWRPGFFDRRVPTLPDSWLRVATYGAIAVPCLAGLVQVAVAIDRILG
jgi:hypothetical protein